MKTTAEKIAVMQAHIDGEEIESKTFGYDWETILIQPRWDWAYNDYRIKPKPLECWVWIYSPCGIGPTYKTKEEADSIAKSIGIKGRAILMREVV